MSIGPRALRGGLVVVDPESGAVRRVLGFQYNPDTLTRAFQLQAPPEGGAAGEAFRLTGPPSQTVTVEVELDALAAPDARAAPDDSPDTVTFGLSAELAALESLAYPPLSAVREAADLLDAGMLEIAAAAGPLVLFAFGRRRVLPVRITELSITEEAFDPMLNPIRAKVRLGLKVLTVNDVGTHGRAAGFALAAHHQLEHLAGRSSTVRLAALGLESI